MNDNKKQSNYSEMMNWLYYIREEKWHPDNTAAYMQIYLRPIMTDKNNEIWTGKVVDYSMVALKFFFNKNIQEVTGNDKYVQIYNQLMNGKDFFLLPAEIPASEQKYYMDWVSMYVVEQYNKCQLLKWIRIFFQIKGYACEELKEGIYDDFAGDVNRIMRMFSLENVKKFEPELGKEWWKHKKKPGQNNKDNEMINNLLKEIRENKN